MILQRFWKLARAMVAVAVHPLVHLLELSSVVTFDKNHWLTVKLDEFLKL